MYNLLGQAPSNVTITWSLIPFHIIQRIFAALLYQVIHRNILWLCYRGQSLHQLYRHTERLVHHLWVLLDHKHIITSVYLLQPLLRMRRNVNRTFICLFPIIPATLSRLHLCYFASLTLFSKFIYLKRKRRNFWFFIILLYQGQIRRRPARPADAWFPCPRYRHKERQPAAGNRYAIQTHRRRSDENVQDNYGHPPSADAASKLPVPDMI